MFQTPIQAIIFDYGNTIIPYGRQELNHYGDQVFAAMEELYGTLDRQRFDECRQASRMEPYRGDPPVYRENDMAAITAELVRELCGREALPAELQQLMEARHDAFVNAVTVDEESVAALQTLSERFPIGLLSNYPDGGAIRASLDKIGIDGLFRSVVISGELGYVKPHPVAFAKSLEELGVPAPACLFVGDNWLADVQGAKRIGMKVAHMKRWAPPEAHERSAGDQEPDWTIDTLGDVVTGLAESNS